jgi:predicted  nucleic acid-binding Zn-ribbon protein
MGKARKALVDLTEALESLRGTVRTLVGAVDALRKRSDSDEYEVLQR